jgi:hypothetical protein
MSFFQKPLPSRHNVYHKSPCTLNTYTPYPHCLSIKIRVSKGASTNLLGHIAQNTQAMVMRRRIEFY